MEKDTKPALHSGGIVGSAVSIGMLGGIYATVEPFLGVIQEVLPQLSALRIQGFVVVGTLANIYSIYRRVRSENKKIKGVI